MKNSVDKNKNSNVRITKICKNVDTFFYHIIDLKKKKKLIKGNFSTYASDTYVMYENNKRAIKFVLHIYGGLCLQPAVQGNEIPIYLGNEGRTRTTQTCRVQYGGELRCCEFFTCDDHLCSLIVDYSSHWYEYLVI